MPSRDPLGWWSNFPCVLIHNVRIKQKRFLYIIPCKAWVASSILRDLLKLQDSMYSTDWRLWQLIRVYILPYVPKHSSHLVVILWTDSECSMTFLIIRSRFFTCWIAFRFEEFHVAIGETNNVIWTWAQKVWLHSPVRSISSVRKFLNLIRMATAQGERGI